MAKVRFIRDTEESILGASPADGTIYVSTDTNNIYIGTASGFERLTKGYTLSKSGNSIVLTDNEGHKTTVTDADTKYSNATGSAAGLMSASDKTKLDNLDSTISAAIGEEASARQKQDQLLEQTIEDKLGADDIIAGNNVQVNHDDESGHVTISATVPQVTLASLGITATAQELNYTDGVTSNIQTQLNGKAAASHTHDDRYYTEDEVDGLLAAKANTSHTHSADNITSGTLALDRIPTITDAKIQGMSASKLTGTIPQANLPSYVDDVLEYNGQSHFPPTGESGKIYVDTSTNRTYRWGGSSYVEISSSLALGTTSSTAFRGDYGNIAYQHAQAKGSAFASGLYKITTNAQGHVTAATAVTKNDITALGIPGSDTNTNTTYTLSKSGSTIKLEGSDGSSSEVTDANTTYTLSSFGITATAAELNYMDGVTSNVQTQLNGKAASSHTHNTASTTAAGFLRQLNGSTSSFLRGDGTWATPPNTTYSTFGGASTSAGGSTGLVPAPSAGAATRYLRSDGTWAVPPDTNTTYTLSSFGITATAAELNRLDGVTATTTEINYLDGVTSAIQTQLNNKASISHTHSNYLPLSGGTLTGTVTSRNLTPSTDSTYDIGTNYVRYRNIYADTFTGSLSGNATSADQWTMARTLTLNGDVSGSTSIRGNSNMSLATTLAYNSVDTANIVNGAVTRAKLSGEIGTVAVSETQPTDSSAKIWIQI